MGILTKKEKKYWSYGRKIHDPYFQNIGNPYGLVEETIGRMFRLFLFFSLFVFVVENAEGRLIAIEWKATLNAAANQPKNQVLADGWIDQHGGVVFGKRGRDAGFNGRPIDSVILLYPGKSAPKL
jgi:hypothetical protein